MDFLNEFVKRATASGLTDEQAVKFVQDNFMGGKTAEQHLDEFYGEILKSASIEKNPYTVAYVDSFVKSAVQAGCNVEQAAKLTVMKLASINPKKQELDPKTAAYLTGFAERAKEAGLKDEQIGTLIQKLAEGPGGTRAAGIEGINDPQGFLGASPESLQRVEEESNLRNFINNLVNNNTDLGGELSAGGGDPSLDPGSELSAGGGVENKSLLDGFRKLFGGKNIDAFSQVDPGGEMSPKDPGQLEQFLSIIKSQLGKRVGDGSGIAKTLGTAQQYAPELGMGAAGAGLGALLGKTLTPEPDPEDPEAKDNSNRNALLAALLGGGAGALGGNLFKQQVA